MQANIAPLERLSASAHKQTSRAYEHDAVTATQAQAEVNFVILMPPPYRNNHGDFVQTFGTLRREAAPAIRVDVGGDLWPSWTCVSPCSFRFEWPFRDADNNVIRAVRVKQFLPDFPMLVPLGSIHPSAIQRPASAGSAAGPNKVGLAREAARVIPFTMPGSRAGWIGLNAAGQRSAVFLTHGTLVEVSEISGNFETEEMKAFCASLVPISQEAVSMVNATPLAKLTYFSRYSNTKNQGYACHVSRQIASSLFRIRWPVPFSGASRWTEDISVAEKWFGWPPGGGVFGRGRRVLNQLMDLQWRPDSVCVVSADGQSSANSSGDGAENPAEVMLVCFPAEGPRHQVLWLRRIRRWPGCPLTPRDETANKDFNWDDDCIDDLRPVTTAWVNALGCGDVRVAWVSERYGPFEALAWASDNMFLLQVSPSDNASEIQSQSFQQMARSLGKALLG